MRNAANNAAHPVPIRLALGPIAYYWDRDAVFTFYEEMADAPVDIVYLGEGVCPKRRSLALADWIGLAEALAGSGKEVVLTTLALIEAGSDLSTVRRIVENGRFAIEANDMAAVNLASGRTPFVAGATINAYNARTLRILRAAGAVRWVAPLELGRRTLASLGRERPEGLELELFAFGRMPLAFSARCFTARAHDLPKDACALRCRDYPDGMPLATLEQEPFLVLNGIQIQSARTYSLAPYVAELAALGASVLRISPQRHGTPEILAVFRGLLDGGLDPGAAEEALRPHAVHGFCAGYWEERPGMERKARA